MFYHALIGKGGDTPTDDLEPVLLWENSSPTSEFAAQTVSLDLSDYAGVLVEYERSIALNDVISRAYVKKEDYDIVGFGAGNGGGYGSAVSAAGRSVKVDDNGVIFGNGYSTAEDNSAFIPVKIYGVKGYVVEPEYTKFTITISNDAGSNSIEKNIFKNAKVTNTSSNDGTRDIILSDGTGQTVTVSKGVTKTIDISSFEKLIWSTTDSVFVNGTIELTL